MKWKLLLLKTFTSELFQKSQHYLSNTLIFYYLSSMYITFGYILQPCLIWPSKYEIFIFPQKFTTICKNKCGKNIPLFYCLICRVHTMYLYFYLLLTWFSHQSIQRPYCWSFLSVVHNGADFIFESCISFSCNWSRVPFFLVDFWMIDISIFCTS